MKQKFIRITTIIALISFGILSWLVLTRPLPIEAVTPGGVANLSINPSTGNPNPGQFQVDIRLNVAGRNVFGTDIYAHLSTQNPGSVTFTPATITGFDVWTNTITPAGNGVDLYHSRGTNPGSTYTNNTAVTLGTLTFTGSYGETATLTFTSASTVFEDITFQDILNATLPTGSYTFTSAPTATPTVTIQPSPTVTTQPTPTRTPTPTVTNQPTPTPSPTLPAPTNVTITFRMQGITTNIGNLPNVKLILKPTVGGTEVTYPNLTATSVATNDGAYTLTHTVPAGTYNVCLQTNSHLKRCFRQGSSLEAFTFPAVTTINRNAIAYDNDSLRPGDVTGNDNKINLLDVTTISNARGQSFRTAVNPANATHLASDLNRDGFLTIDDLALAVINYSAFEMPGDP